jgi:hypothetical protein
VHPVHKVKMQMCAHYVNFICTYGYAWSARIYISSVTENTWFSDHFVSSYVYIVHYHEYPRTVSVMLNVTLMAMCKGWLVQLECFWLEGYVYLRTIGYSLKNIGTIYIFTTTCCIKYIREKCSPTNNIYITWNKMITKSWTHIIHVSGMLVIHRSRRDCMVIWLATTYAVSNYHHQRSVFEYSSGRVY